MTTKNCRWALAGAISASALLIAGCGGGQAPVSADNLPGLEIEGLDPELIRAAAEEGEVVLRTGAHTPERLELLEEEMRELFGIEVIISREASSDVYSSVEAERASGNIQTDVIGLTDAIAFKQLASEDALVDPQVPNRDQINPTYDDGSTVYIPYAVTAIGVMYNSASTDAGALPATWEELLQTDARLLTANPNASGTALNFYSWLMQEHPSFIEQLGATEPSVTDSSLSLSQMVLSGEVDAAIPAVEGEVMSLAADGEPVATKFMDGPVPASVSFLGQLAEAPNPNAAQLLVHYHLSEEFQTAIAEAGRPVLTGVDTGPALEDLGDRAQPVTSEMVEEFGEKARSTFTDEVA